MSKKRKGSCLAGISTLLLWVLIFLPFGCRVKKSEQKQSHLSINEQVQAVSIATKQIDRLILRLDSLSLVVAEFDEDGRLKRITQAKQGTKTTTKERETAQDSVVAKKEQEQVLTQNSSLKTHLSNIVPSILWWVLGGVVLLLLVALLIRLLRR